MPTTDPHGDYKLLVKEIESEEIDVFLSLIEESGLTFPPCDTKEAYEKTLKSDASRALVAYANGTLVGAVVVTYSPLMSMISHLCVSSSHRGQGIAKYLLQTAKMRVESLGGTEVYISYISIKNKESLSLGKKFDCGVWNQELYCVYKEA